MRRGAKSNRDPLDSPPADDDDDEVLQGLPTADGVRGGGRGMIRVLEGVAEGAGDCDEGDLTDGVRGGGGGIVGLMGGVAGAIRDWLREGKGGRNSDHLIVAGVGHAHRQDEMKTGIWQVGDWKATRRS